jgi:ABC-type bacteriocin/lantibiotic exporter with double-glycine peptidase domain
MRMVREDVSDAEIIEALKTACAWEFVSKIPDGINGTLGEHGRGISEGQAQRLSIARALIRNAPIMLLDEATSALDSDTEKQVLNNIIKRYPNKLIIVSTHRLGVLNLCDRICRIVDGKIKELDNIEAEQILSEGNISELYFRNVNSREQETRVVSRMINEAQARSNDQDTYSSDSNMADSKGWWNI